MAKSNDPFDAFAGLRWAKDLYKSPLGDIATQISQAHSVFRSPLEGVLPQIKWIQDLYKSSLEGVLPEMKWIQDLYKSSLEGVLPEMKWIRDLHKSSLEGVFPQMKWIQDLHSSSLEGVLPQMKWIQDLHKSSLEGVLPEMKWIQDLHKSPLGNLTSQLTSLRELIATQHSVSKFAAQIAATGVAGGFDPALVEAAVMAAELAEHSDDDESSESLTEARSQSLVVDAVAASRVVMLQESVATPEELRQQAAAVLTEIFVKTIARLGSAISRQEIMALVALLSLIWSVVWSVLNYQWTKQSAEESSRDQAKFKTEIREENAAQLEELKKSRETLERILKEISQEDGSRTFYRVERRTYLMAERSMDAEKLMELRPGQHVLRVQRQYKWLEVECYDYLAGKVQKGWVLKSNLHLIED